MNIHRMQNWLAAHSPKTIHCVTHPNIKLIALSEFNVSPPNTRLDLTIGQVKLGFASKHFMISFDFIQIQLVLSNSSILSANNKLRSAVSVIRQWIHSVLFSVPWYINSQLTLCVTPSSRFTTTLSAPTRTGWRFTRACTKAWRRTCRRRWWHSRTSRSSRAPNLFCTTLKSGSISRYPELTQQKLSYFMAGPLVVVQWTARRNCFLTTWVRFHLMRK